MHCVMHWANGEIKMNEHANLIGEKFPDFSLKDSSGESFSQDSLLDVWSVISFFPKGGSPRFTIESCTLRDKQAEIEALGAQVIAISTDSMTHHRRFKKKYAIEYKLLCDIQGRLSKKLNLKRILEVMRGRVTFVVDPKCFIRGVITTDLLMHAKSAICQLVEFMADESSS